MSTSSPLRERSVAALLTVVFLTSVGVFAQATALGKLVYDISGRELDLGLLGLAEFLPAAVLVLVTGHVADRFDRRRILMLALIGEAAVAGVIAWYATTEPSSVAPLLGLALAFGTARAFAAPAMRALPANVAPPGTLPKVTAANSAAWQSALIAGPILAGFLYAGGPSWPFVAAVVLALLAALTLLLVRLPEPQRIEPAAVESTAPSDEDDDAESLSGAREGLRFIRRTPILLAAISLDLFAVLFGGAVALLPAIAEQRLGVGAVGLGWLRAAGGVGAVVMALALARRPVSRHVGRVLLVAVAVFGLATVALGFTTSFMVAFTALAVLSAADMVSVFIRATIVPLATPDEVRGRVLAAENVFIGASNELGAFESGVAGQLLGVAPAVVLGGVATLGIAALWWVRFPVLRDLDRFSDLTVPTGAAPETATGEPLPTPPS